MREFDIPLKWIEVKDRVELLQTHPT